jgi:glucose/arabinose dehydrogenase
VALPAVALAVGLMVLGSAASGRTEAGEGATRGGGGLALKRIGSFSSPTYVHGPKGAGNLIFVVERQGRILVLEGDRPRGTFLDIRGKVRCCDGERGMFSVAFANYRRSKRFYVYYTDGKGDLRIDEFKIRRRGDRPRAARRSGRRVLDIRHRAAANHNGGQLQFGPDGLLYVATGDGGGGGDPAENAQDKTSLLGKLLRIDPRKNGRRPYRVPGSNPYAGKRRRGDGEIYARGLRNPYRFSWNGGRIAIGDVGQERFEEVDYETRRSLRGANFGWDNYEGFSPYEGGGLRGHDRPIHVYSHSSGCAITGGYVVRDPDLPSLRGRYVYGDLCTGQIRSLKPRLRRARGDSATGLPSPGGLVSFGEDARRNVYVVAGGRVSRIVRR